MEFEDYLPDRTLYLETIKQSETVETLFKKLYQLYTQEIESSIPEDAFISRIYLPKFESTGQLQGFAFIEFQNIGFLNQLYELYSSRRNHVKNVLESSNTIILSKKWILMHDWISLRREYQQWHEFNQQMH